MEDSFQVNDNFSPDTDIEDSFQANDNFSDNFSDNNVETGPGDQVADNEVDVEL